MKNLVICPNGNDSIINQWENHGSVFDLWTFSYDDLDLVDRYSDKNFKIRNTKFKAVQEILNDISGYQYVWIPDDDIMMSIPDIREMFSVVNHYDLDIAQPSYSLDSYFGEFPHFRRRKNYQVRKTNFIDIRCPLFKVDKLKSLSKTFNSILGNNIYWSFSPYFFKMGIIDSVCCWHTRVPYETNFYHVLSENDLNYQELMKSILDEYQVKSVKDFLIVEGGINFED